MGICGCCNTGISVYFWLDIKYFDLLNFFVLCLINNLCVKVVFCFGLEIIFIDKVNNNEYCWLYEDGLKDYLVEGVKGYILLLEELFTGEFIV